MRRRIKFSNNCTRLIYIIWYEQFADNHRRTIINQLVSSQVYIAVFYNIFGQSLDVIITAFGPFGSLLCYFQQYIRGIATFQFIQLSTTIFTIKYLYIFVIKNPAGVREEFWYFFINIGSLFFSCITEFIHQFMPGRRLIQFYICTGRFDNSLDNEKVKRNYVVLCYLALAMIWYLFASFKISKYKKQLKCIPTVFVAALDRQTRLALLIKDIFQAALVNLVVIGAILFILFLNILLRAYSSTLAPAFFNEGLHFHMYYFIDHGSIVVSYVCFVVIYYYRNSNMRQTILREIKDDFLQLRERLSM
jgi:hypothetical protein